MFGLKSVNKGSVLSFHQLSDKLNVYIRAPETICTNEKLVNLVTSKLDPQSQAKWEEGIHNDNLPRWKSMALFLKRRCRILENLERSIGPTIPNRIVGKKANNNSGRNVLITSGTGQPISTFCEVTTFMHFREAKRLSLCLNYLRKGHIMLNVSLDLSSLLYETWIRYQRSDR